MNGAGDPFAVVRQFEKALCQYTGAKYAVTTTSCTMAILLAVAYHLRNAEDIQKIVVPKRTYVGVPMSIIHAGGWPKFCDHEWAGAYQLGPLPVWDSARWFTSGLYSLPASQLPAKPFVCVSFHHTKTLGISTHGGAILHADDAADEWLRRARFDGRRAGVHPQNDSFDMLGWHCYMTPPTAAEGLQRLASLPDHNEPLPWGPGTASDYPDLSRMEVFQ